MTTFVLATKEFTFDCCHLLTGHQGLCKNLHGHTYKVQVTVATKRGELLKHGPAEGMVLDFKDLKGTLKEGLFDAYDHAYIYNSEGGAEERQIGALVKSFGMRYVDMKMRPTAENMAKLFLEKGQELVDPLKVRIISVKVWETPTSFAEAVV